MTKTNHSTKNERDLWVDRYHSRTGDAYQILRAICKAHLTDLRTPYGGIYDSAKEILEFVEQKPITEILGI